MVVRYNTNKIVEEVLSENSYNRSKKSLIDNPRHLVLETVHPSPLSAYNGFFGCKHFSKANEFLKQNGRAPIDWRIE